MRLNRRELKSQAKASLKRNYAKMLLLCLILMLIAGEFSGSWEMTSITDPTAGFQGSGGILEKKDNAQILGDTIHGGSEKEPSVLEKIGMENPTEGVFAGIFNSITSSGSVLFGFLNAVNNMVFGQGIGKSTLLFLGSVLSFLYWLFVQQLLAVGGRRYFLEARTFYKTGADRILLPYKVKRTVRTAMAMFRTWAYKILWSLTVVGGFVKWYSYYLVPFILAENPDIDGRSAITLSRRMMNGYKWKAFLLSLSFLGWDILNGATAGLLGIFFLNPYKMSVQTEFYMKLRREARVSCIPGAELLNDVQLDAAPVDGVYPPASFPLPVHTSRKWLNVDFRKNYSLLHLVLMFFIFSFVGWCWEVSLHLFQEGEFVNRGVLFGPWLPIYGSGGVMMLVLLKRFRENHLLTFVMAILLSGIVEYATSVWLEYTHDGLRWWDYTGYFCNINGRVCLEGLLTFGAGGCLFIYIVAPLLEELLVWVPNKIGWTVAVVLMCLFLSDVVYSGFHPNTGDGVADYKEAGATLEGVSAIKVDLTDLLPAEDVLL